MKPGRPEGLRDDQWIDRLEGLNSGLKKLNAKSEQLITALLTLIVKTHSFIPNHSAEDRALADEIKGVIDGAIEHGFLGEKKP